MRLPVRLVSLARLASLAGLLALVSGCSSEHEVAEKQLADMRTELTRVRASQAAMSERLDALEIERGSFQKGAATAPSASPASSGSSGTASGATGDADRPALDVVHLSPSEGDGDADVDGQRPVIRAVGSDGTIQKAPKGSAPRAAGKKGVAAGTPPKKASSDTDPRPTAKP